MKTYMKHILTTAVWLVLAAIAYPQTPDAEHLTVSFSDPSRPGTVKVGLISGSISVKGYNGKEVIVDAKQQSSDEEQGQRRARGSRPETEGLKRIPNFSTGLKIEEEDNVVSINAGLRPVDIIIQVPSRTNLILKTINNGDIKAEQVQGEIEVNNIQGGVTLVQVSGSVVAHALNGAVKVNLVGVGPGKPMSFSSLNGDIDVTLPSDIKANVSMKSDNGEIYSDFDIKLDPKASQPVPEDAQGKEGKRYQIKMDRTMKGMINGGGPEIQFRTFDGNIYIRKSSK